MATVYRCTASEDSGELEAKAVSVNGVVLPETETYWPSIQTEDESAPAQLTFTNSGTIQAEDLSIIAGGHPQRPK